MSYNEEVASYVPRGTFLSAKQGQLGSSDHYAAKLWESMNWTTSMTHRQCLLMDICEKRKNIEKCHRYYASGAQLKAKGNLMPTVLCADPYEWKTPNQTNITTFDFNQSQK